MASFKGIEEGQPPVCGPPSEQPSKDQCFHHWDLTNFPTSRTCTYCRLTEPCVMSEPRTSNPPSCDIHSWVGDDDCAYCEIDRLRARIVELEGAADDSSDAPK